MRSQLTGYSVTPAQLAYMLSWLNQVPINDRTGLGATYDMHLQWTPDPHLLSAAEVRPAPAPDPDSPSLYTALEEQLGLKLEAGKGPIPTLQVDHAQPPTAN